MVRAPCCEKMGLKRGPWSPEEDQILVSYIQQYGHGNWRALPKQAGLLRCGKSCRLRWTNYLRPDIKRGNFSREEEETIIELHKNLGNRWSAIAARLPGRTDNEIKNVWHTHIKKKLNCHSQNQSPRDSKSQSKSIIPNSNCDNEVSQNSNVSSTISEQIVTTSPQHCSSEMSSVTDSSIEEKMVKSEEMDYSSGYLPQIDESFWSDELTIEDIDLLSKGNEEKIELQSALSGEQRVEMDAILDDNMDFWYDLFVRAGEVPELPEF